MRRFRGRLRPGKAFPAPANPGEPRSVGPLARAALWHGADTPREHHLFSVCTRTPQALAAGYSEESSTAAAPRGFYVYLLYLYLYFIDCIYNYIIYL